MTGLLRSLLPAAALALVFHAAHAVTPEQLTDLIAGKTQIIIIDIRVGSHYSNGHIPSAINIAAESVARRRLPPFGRVVVYGDGIDEARTRKATEEINAKPGISAEMLEGGLPAWESLNLPNTRAGGSKPENLRYVTYQDLQRILSTGRDIILVDLRRNSGDGLLGERFPNASVIRPSLNGKRFGLSLLRGSPLFVLIGDGSGAAERVARKLVVRGQRRYAILAGGERIVRRDGRPGLSTNEQSVTR